MVPRTTQTRRVQQRIYADRPQCVSVVGDPRIGKSTFLDGLAASAEAGDPAPPPGTRFVRLAVAGPLSTSPTAFLGMILGALADGAGGTRLSSVPGSPDASPRAYASLETKVQEMAQAGGRLILLLDDFDRITSSPAFPATFFSFLRSLANNFPVAYVTTSRQDLQQLCVSREVEESPFFNIFQNLGLGPLDEAQTRALAAERAPDLGVALADWAWVESGGLPAVAAACCDVARAGKAPGSDEARAALDEALAPYVQELWGHFEETHRGLLARIAAGEAPGERDARPLRDLGPRRGYLRERDGRWVLASEALRRLLARHPGADPSSPGLLRRMKRFFGGGR